MDYYFDWSCHLFYLFVYVLALRGWNESRCGGVWHLNCAILPRRHKFINLLLTLDSQTLCKYWRRTENCLSNSWGSDTIIVIPSADAFVIKTHAIKRHSDFDESRAVLCASLLHESSLRDLGEILFTYELSLVWFRIKVMTKLELKLFLPFAIDRVNV